MIADKVQGDLLGEKKDGCARLVFVKINGISPWYAQSDDIILAVFFNTKSRQIVIWEQNTEHSGT